MQVNPDDKQVIEAVMYTFTAFVLMMLSLLGFVYFSRRKILKKEIEKKDLEIEYQRQLLQSTLVTQEEERQRIARDLHDDISSKLNVISLNAHLLSSRNLSKSDSDEISTNIINVTRSVLENARRIAHDLLPPILVNFGLHAALAELCHSHCSSDLMQIRFANPHGKQAFEHLDSKNHLHVFRILQELINNSIKHGQATLINLELKLENGVCIITYSDNGSGFNTKEVKTKSGIGMKNIISRTTFIGGHFEIQSGKNKGVVATLSF